jgi:hypothetical protein
MMLVDFQARLVPLNGWLFLIASTVLGLLPWVIHVRTKGRTSLAVELLRMDVRNRVVDVTRRAHGEPGLAHLYLTDRRAFDRRLERGRQHFFGPPSGAHAVYLRSKGIID